MRRLVGAVLDKAAADGSPRAAATAIADENLARLSAAGAAVS